MRAAVRPSREVLVGGTAIAAAVAVATRVSPALVDALLSLRRAGIEALREDRLGDLGDIVDAPETGPGRVDGGYRGRVLRHSPITRLLGVARRPVELLTATVGHLHRPTPTGGGSQPRVTRIVASPRRRRRG
ncbi:hypothetical protein ND748_10215 [Frankia sp. AiPs1]|uniref:hypothetical protein n=1 Tax=Frankia sp. AiPs1 TaxID=573493 RepID=UPI002043CE1F|nr:hypothetical protein [Frankia sp. AiPs1]MCM3922030.1 hypothetical protein [Frankia sp. AiPs1]